MAPQRRSAPRTGAAAAAAAAALAAACLVSGASAQPTPTASPNQYTPYVLTTMTNLTIVVDACPLVNTTTASEAAIGAALTTLGSQLCTRALASTAVAALDRNASCVATWNGNVTIPSGSSSYSCVPAATAPNGAVTVGWMLDFRTRGVLEVPPRSIANASDQAMTAVRTAWRGVAWAASSTAFWSWANNGTASGLSAATLPGLPTGNTTYTLAALTAMAGLAMPEDDRTAFSYALALRVNPPLSSDANGSGITGNTTSLIVGAAVGGGVAIVCMSFLALLRGCASQSTPDGKGTAGRSGPPARVSGNPLSLASFPGPENATARSSAYTGKTAAGGDIEMASPRK